MKECFHLRPLALILARPYKWRQTSRIILYYAVHESTPILWTEYCYFSQLGYCIKLGLYTCVPSWKQRLQYTKLEAIHTTTYNKLEATAKEGADATVHYKHNVYTIYVHILLVFVHTCLSHKPHIYRSICFIQNIFGIASNSNECSERYFVCDTPQRCTIDQWPIHQSSASLVPPMFGARSVWIS